jgi:hypothetical protein
MFTWINRDFLIVRKPLFDAALNLSEHDTCPYFLIFLAEQTVPWQKIHQVLAVRWKAGSTINNTRLCKPLFSIRELSLENTG